MRCSSPRTVGFQPDGKSLCWSQKQYCKEYATFQLPCGKCLECRLDYARQWAVRCVHEAQMHPENCFITLTYSDEHLKSPKLDYKDFQDFMKRLRKTTNNKVGVFVTGEYGEITKRPHWHAILFNYSPKDLKYLRQNERGDKIYSSSTLDKLWGKNDPQKKPNEIGSVTMDSAGYCARYAAKKLVHGSDQDHEYHPISKKSSKHAIGKKWLEKFWPDAFNHGRIVLDEGKTCSIPRYYEKWFKQHHFDEWMKYDSITKKLARENAISQAEESQSNYTATSIARGPFRPNPLTEKQTKKIILEDKFNKLQKHLKL